MTEGSDTPQASDVPPLDLRLRPEPPRVMRLSRRVLLALCSVSALAIAGALLYALQTRNKADSGKELLATENRQTADALAGLPKDYTALPRQVPQLGPPLPGDLGRPILNAQTQNLSPQGMDAIAQREQQENEAARVSRLFSQTSEPPGHSGEAPSAAVNPANPSAQAPNTPSIDAGAAQNMQDRKLAFVNGPSDKRTVSPDRLERAVSTYVVQAGSIIPAALITGIRSDLPGEITAQVTEAVYDSPSGHYLLIPQGARLIGQYDSSIAFGQSRVLLVWNRIIMPNGSSIVLERLPGADTQGYAGLEDDVDYHWWELARAAALSTLLGIGEDIGQTTQESDLVHALRQGSQDSISNTGQLIVRRQLNVQPTLTIRPGFPVRIVVNHDLVLEPYKA